ncbi:MAG TPA: hypothetical protein VLL52_01410 [Anaerolineae bacterium]|nr:hypothetical protein [Anaerolineae bacterium]
MSITGILGAVFSLILIYYALSLIINAIMAVIKDILDLRANALNEILIDLFHQSMTHAHDTTLYQRFMQHELIVNLKPVRYWFLSHQPRDLKMPKIKYETFALALFDTLDSKELLAQNLINPLLEKADAETQGLLQSLLQPFETDEQFLDKAQQVLAKIPDHHTKTQLNKLVTFLQLPPEDQLHRVQMVVNTLPKGKTKNTLQALLKVGYDDVDSAHRRLQIWFNDSMARVSSLFAQRANAYVIIISFLITLFIGTDTILIVRSLWEQPARNQVVNEQLMPIVETFGNQMIQENADNLTSDQLVQEISQQLNNITLIIDQLQNIDDIPVTWNILHPLPFLVRANWPPNWLGWDGILAKIIGLIFTAVAISRGSSFWYDIIKYLNPNNYRTSK